MNVSSKNPGVALRILSTKGLFVKGKDGRVRQGGGWKRAELLDSPKRRWEGWLAHLLVFTCVSDPNLKTPTSRILLFIFQDYAMNCYLQGVLFIYPCTQELPIWSLVSLVLFSTLLVPSLVLLRDHVYNFNLCNCFYTSYPFFLLGSHLPFFLSQILNE